MNDHSIETIIEEAEKRARNSSMFGARLMGTMGVCLGPMALLSLGLELGTVFGCVFGFVTVSLWKDGRKSLHDQMKSRARMVWREIDHVGAFKQDTSLKERELVKDIGRIYERDPQGQTFPLSQAIRLALAWKQQQKRLKALSQHIEQIRSARTILLEKQRLLRELNEENTSLDHALARLNNDLTPLERNRDALRASCTRLESLVVEVESSLRRRELHREIGQLTARLSSGKMEVATLSEAPDEHLDLERQIAREIETYLQLERETDAQLRDL